MSEQTVEIEQRGAAAWIWLNRPALHNALSEDLVSALTAAFTSLADDPGTRVIVLTGRGRSFCAGADIESMQRQGASSPMDNLANARELAEMFRTIASCSRPTVARVNGAAIGGGLGLVCACDIAIALEDAKFAASEVRLGLIPGTIGPYVVRAVGPRWARRLFLTGERFSAPQAQNIGLIHESCDAGEFDPRVQFVAEALLAGAPGAQKAAKELVDSVAGQAITPDLIDETAMRIASIRAGEEAREGLQAYLEKRAPSWLATRA